MTPEGVDLGATLASVAVRAAALFVDLVLQWLILGVFFVMIVLVLLATGIEAPPALPLIVWILGAFVMRNFWFVGWEMTPRGATPGKRLMSIRVAMRNGGRLTADAVFARNVTREMEIFLPLSALAGVGATAGAGPLSGPAAIALLVWTLTFALIPFFNRDRLRAGDLLGGTWVVEAPRHRLEPDLARDQALYGDGLVFTREQLDAYGVMELQVLEGVLRQKDKPVLKDVARRIREKIGWTSGDESDLAFLQAYYAALRQRLEQRMLMGHRRKDKHDRSGLR